MNLQPNDIHIWVIALKLPEQEIEREFQILSTEEQKRANRFHFSQHRHQFIAAHSAMRRILSHYTAVLPEKIVFYEHEHGKPYLKNSLHFNLGHSHQLALLGIAKDAELGIDIETIESTYEPGVAKRFYHPQENEEIDSLSGHEQVQAFYRVWARKEAIVKAEGSGLHLPLKSFKVSSKPVYEVVQANDRPFRLLSLAIDPEFEAAVASTNDIQRIFLRRYDQQISTLD